jgi:hypothetical protein
MIRLGCKTNKVIIIIENVVGRVTASEYEYKRIFNVSIYLISQIFKAARPIAASDAAVRRICYTQAFHIKVNQTQMTIAYTELSYPYEIR